MKERYPDAAVRWCVDENMPPGIKRRIGVAFKSKAEKDRCIGFFVVSWGEIHVSFEEASVYNAPKKAEHMPEFIRRELFKAAGADAQAVLGAVFDNETEVVRYYKKRADFTKDINRIINKKG